MARFGGNIGPTPEQRRALLWLRQNGRYGVLADNRRLFAANGEQSPFVNGVWFSLDIIGFVKIKRDRVTITRSGAELKIDNVAMEN